MRRWTKGEDDLARELAADGYVEADIAAELPGRTPRAVHNRFGRVGVRAVRGGRPNVELRSLVLSLVAVGVTSGYGVAKRIGRHKRVVQKLMAKLEREGLVGRAGRDRNTRWHVTKKWNGMDGPPEELGEWVGRGDSCADIARRSGRHPDTVERWVKALGEGP